MVTNNNKNEVHLVHPMHPKYGLVGLNITNDGHAYTSLDGL